MLFSFIVPPFFLLLSFALPPYQSRCKVGAKSVKARFYSEVSSSLVGRIIGGNFSPNIWRFHGNCVSLHPDSTKRKEIIMLREPIIIKNPSAKALELIERMKENKRQAMENMRKNRDLAILIK